MVITIIIRFLNNHIANMFMPDQLLSLGEIGSAKGMFAVIILGLFAVALIYQRVFSLVIFALFIGLIVWAVNELK